MRLHRWMFVEAARRYRERAVIAVAWALPRSIAYWAAIRVAAHATQGPYSNQVVPDLLVMDALKRWDTVKIADIPEGRAVGRAAALDMPYQRR